jgi:protein TonB
MAPSRTNTNDARAAPSAALDASQPVSFISKVPPVYPPEEECLGTTGKIMLQITVSADGDPINIKIERSSHNRHLDDAAIGAAKKWKFKPATRNGKETQRIVRVPVDFQPTSNGNFGKCAFRE